MVSRFVEVGRSLIAPQMAEIEAATGYKSELWLLDLAEFASVLEFVEKFEKDGGKIDILVANAGAVWSDYRETVDGWEQTYALEFFDLALVLTIYQDPGQLLVYSSPLSIVATSASSSF